MDQIPSPSSSSQVSVDPHPPATNTTPISEPAPSNATPSPANKGTKVWTSLFLVLTLGACALAGYLFLENQKLQNALTLQSMESSQAESEMPSIDQQTENSPVESETGPYVYKLNMTTSLQTGDTPGGIVPLIEDYFGIPLLRFKGNPSIFFSARDKTSPYDQTSESQIDYQFYIATFEPLDATEFSSQESTGSVELQSSSLLPYLMDAKYCRADSDCMIRANSCEIGGFNQFHTFIDGPWGCGPGNYEGVPDAYLQEEAERARLSCATFAEVKYEGATCENQRCVANNPSWQCSPPLPNQ